MDHLWLCAPALAIKVWRDAKTNGWRANPALLSWAAGRDVTPAQWQALADSVLSDDETAHDAGHEEPTARMLRFGDERLRCTSTPMGEARLAWLTPDMAVPADGAHVEWLANERMRQQEALNARLTQAVNLSAVSIWRIDLSTQRIELNDAGYRSTGLPARLGGVPVDDVRATIHPDDLGAVLQAERAAIESNAIIDVEARYRNDDGSYRHLLTRRVAERDAAGRVVALAGVSIDQSQRIAERERARSLAHRIDIITRAAGVGVWSIDVTSGAVEWNDQMRMIYGVPPDAPVPSMGEALERFVHPEDRAAVVQRHAHVRGPGSQGSQLEFRIVRPDGAVRWVSSWTRREHALDGRLMAYGVTIDVTERVQAHARLREMDERASLAAEAVGIGSWELDCVTGEVLWNAQMYRLRGLSPDCGMTAEQARAATHHEQDLVATKFRLEQARIESRDYEHEFRVIWPDGTLHWLATRSVVRRDAAGKVVRMTGVNWDVTERLRAEQALRDKASAEEASRAKSEFLSRMSHELRTPLNAVLGFAQLLLRDAQESLGATQGEHVQHIHFAGLHLRALIDDVLDLASIESNTLKLDLQPVPLQAALADVLQWTKAQADAAGVAIHAEAMDGWVLADERRLRQVLANLLSNAVKYNRSQGDVWLQCRPHECSGTPGWQISVRDNGRGMSAQQRRHLFEPFNRLGAERDGIEGTGIGLTIVRSLVDLMGGAIEVETHPGQGSEFRICLPQAQPASAIAPRGADEAATQTPHANAVMTVLYVEDNSVNVLLVEQLMSLRPDMRLLCARDGERGVALARSAAPDVVLIDIQLPDFDGFEVLRRLRGEPQLAASAFIALSANAMPEEVGRAKAAGFNDYWTKPIDVAHFLGGLDALAARMRHPASSLLPLSAPQGARRSRTQAAPSSR
jgi:PAS domain S-box-containing protein